jgi:hypothetical protein
MCARRCTSPLLVTCLEPLSYHRSASAGTDQLATLQQLLSLAPTARLSHPKPLTTSSQQLYLYPSRSRMSMSSTLSRSTHLSSIPIGPPS